MRWTPPLAALVLAVACAAPPPPPPPIPPARHFDAARAWQDLEVLAAIGSRASGSEGAARARAYLRSQLAASDIEVREWAYDAAGEPLGSEEPAPEAEMDTDAEAGEAEASVEEALGGQAPAGPAEDASAMPAEPAIVHVGGVIPGELDDLVVLAARYDSAPDAGPAANAAAAGPALVLELARALAADPLPYTTWAVFLDGGDPAAVDPEAEVEPQRGVQAWVGELRDEGRLARVRVALVFQRVADPEAPILRDLLSHRPYRQVFWEVAEDREDAAEAFPPGLGFTSVDAAHTVLLRAGLRRVVAIAGEPPAVEREAEGDPEDGGEAEAPPADTVEGASRERLAVVGEVTLEGLDLLTERLAKVDRLVPEPEPAAVESAPEGSESP